MSNKSLAGATPQMPENDPACGHGRMDLRTTFSGVLQGNIANAMLFSLSILFQRPVLDLTFQCEPPES